MSNNLSTELPIIHFSDVGGRRAGVTMMQNQLMLSFPYSFLNMTELLAINPKRKQFIVNDAFFITPDVQYQLMRLDINFY